MTKKFQARCEKGVASLAKKVMFAKDTHAFVQTTSGEIYSHIEMTLTTSCEDEVEALESGLYYKILHDVEEMVKGEDFIFVWRTTPELFVRSQNGENQYTFRVRFAVVPATGEIYNPREL
jgi:hypothetical protein